MVEAAAPAWFQVLGYAVLRGIHLAPGLAIPSPDEVFGPAPRISVPSSPNLAISSQNLAGSSPNLADIATLTVVSSRSSCLCL